MECVRSAECGVWKICVFSNFDEFLLARIVNFAEFFTNFVKPLDKVVLNVV